MPNVNPALMCRLADLNSTKHLTPRSFQSPKLAFPVVEVTISVSEIVYIRFQTYVAVPLKIASHIGHWLEVCATSLNKASNFSRNPPVFRDRALPVLIELVTCSSSSLDAPE